MNTLAGFYKNLVTLSYLKAGIIQTRRQQIFEVSAYSLVAFMTPIFLFQSQLFLGAIVNSMLITGALYMRGRSLLPVIMLPSLGVLAKGILFGPFTMYLVMMVPFIWVGNAILVFSIKSIHLKRKKSYLLSASVGSLVKAGFLFAAATLMFSFGFVPMEFLAAFGVMQFITAFSAGLIVFPVNWARLRKK